MSDIENKIPALEGNSVDSEPSSLDIDPIKSPDEISEPAPQMEAAPPEVVEPEPETEEPKKEGKVRRFFRRLFRWTLGILILLGLGFIAAIYALYRPELQNNRDKVSEMQSLYETAQEQLTELETNYQSQIADLQGQITSMSPMAEENEKLLAAQDDYLLQTAVLNVRLDVAYAQLGLANDDAPRAQIALSQTADTLAEIYDLLPENQQGVVTSMQQRLEFILEEIEEEPYAAQSDLDVLEKSLLELESALFGGP